MSNLFRRVKSDFFSTEYRVDGRIIRYLFVYDKCHGQEMTVAIYRLEQNVSNIADC